MGQLQAILTRHQGKIADGMFVHAGTTPLGAKAGSLRMTHPGCVGWATQPRLAGGWTPTLNVMERARSAGGAVGRGRPLECVGRRACRGARRK